MIQSPPNTIASNGRAAGSDDLDRMLSTFFKSQMKQPWPTPPTPVAMRSEPSELAIHSSRTDAAPMQTPARADHGNRARYTLALSVAFLLGMCWYLSNGHQPTERPATTATEPKVSPVMVPNATANEQDVLEQLRKDKAKKNDPKDFMPPILLP